MKRMALLLGTLSACATDAPRLGLAEAPAGCRQVVLVDGAETPPGAMLRAFERAADGSWRATIGPLPAVVGRGGIVTSNAKREGDGGTPAGTHAIGLAFGRDAHGATRLRYRQATPRDWWIDDPSSPAYNTWVTLPAFERPQVSAEAMLRDDGLYDLGCVVEWNTAPIVPGRGSAIFVHVWRGADAPTAGCVALAREDVAVLLRWLDAAAEPHVVIRP